MEINNTRLEDAFTAIEKAIDAHSQIKRVEGLMGEPEVLLTRLGVTLRIPVKLKGSNRSSLMIKGDGDSLEAAVENMIHGLDHWAEAMS